MIIEIGEMEYTDVQESDLNQHAIDNLDIDTAIDILREEGAYVTVSYGVQICTPSEDHYQDFEHEVFIDTETALEFVLDELNTLQQQKSNLYKLLKEAQQELIDFKKQSYEISDGIRALMGQSV